jgi:hypothetical protein
MASLIEKYSSRHLKFFLSYNNRFLFLNLDKNNWFYLFRIELVHLRLAAVLAPQAEDLGLGTVGHVDELLEPPALYDLAFDTAQDHAVVADLHEEHVALVVCAHVDGEALLLH